MTKFPTEVRSLVSDLFSRANGGMAFVPLNPRVRRPSRGYLVPGMLPEWVPQGGTVDYLDACCYAFTNWLRVSAHPGFRVFELHLDYSDGRFHLGAADWRGSIREAKQLARERGQEAVWDIANSEYVGV